MQISDTVTRDINDFASRFPFSEELAGKSVMVTGATGLIGSLIVRCLQAVRKKYKIELRIIGVARNRDKIKAMFGNSPVEWLTEVNLEEGHIPSAGKVDYLIHCAAPTASSYFISHPVETYLATIQGTNGVLELAKNENVASMVYLSSLEYYGSVDSDREIREDDLGHIDPYNVRSSYSMGKRVAESLCLAYYKEYQVPVKVARLTQVFGPGVSSSDNRVFAQFARSVMAGKEIELHTEGGSSKPYSYTMDAIEAIFYILLKGKDGEAYNVANSSTYISIRDFATLVQDVFNQGKEVVVRLDPGRGYAPDTKLRLNTDKLASLGWEPRHDLTEMFGNLIEYLKETKI